MGGFNPEDIESIVVNLELDDGSSLQCDVICIFEHEGQDYAALTPSDENIEELYFFEVELDDQGDETEMTLGNIEDDSILDDLAKVFEQIMSEEDDDDDDDEEDEEDGKWDEFINKKLD